MSGMSDSPMFLLDACVLANEPVAALLLRLAVKTSWIQVRWTDQILSEAGRALRRDMGWDPQWVNERENKLRMFFPDGWITDYQHLVKLVRNDPLDRHVLAAAAHAGCPWICTFNLRDFRPSHLAPWAVQAVHPDQLLQSLFRRDCEVILQCLEDCAKQQTLRLTDFLESLSRTVPGFAALCHFQCGFTQNRNSRDIGSGTAPIPH